jgi:hypothetical protein
MHYKAIAKVHFVRTPYKPMKSGGRLARLTKRRCDAQNGFAAITKWNCDTQNGFAAITK